MRKNSKQRRYQEKGFSLVELLLVVVIVGIVAAMAVPAFQKGMWAAENSAAYSALRTIHSTQVDFYVQNNRFARLTEINPRLGNSLGTTTGDRIVRGRYVFEMVPVTPTDNDLRTEYVITATRAVAGDVVYKYEISQTGRIVQVLPAGSDVF